MIRNSPRDITRSKMDGRIFVVLIASNKIVKSCWNMIILDILKTLKFYIFKYYIILQYFLICNIIVIYCTVQKTTTLAEFTSWFPVTLLFGIQV